MLIRCWLKLPSVWLCCKLIIVSPKTQQALIDELFACSQPEFSPNGKKIFGVIPKEDLDALLA